MPSELAAKLKDLPQPVVTGLSSFVNSALAIYEGALKSVVLYGSGAEGKLRETSDVNVILVLKSFDSTQADAIRAPYTAAQAAIKLTAMFLLEDEVAEASTAFGQKFSDIHRRHRVLYGDDPFASIQVPRAAVIWRLKQVLLNLVLRLREGYIERGMTPERIPALIADTAGPMRSCAATLLELEGTPDVAPKEALRRIVASFQENGWEEVLAHISQAREDRPLAPSVADRTLVKLMELGSRLRSRVIALE